MSLKLRNIVVILVTVIILGVMNMWVVQDQRLSQEGTVLLVEAEFSEPQESPIGDYIGLSYDIPDRFLADSSVVEDGEFVVSLDDDKVASIKRRYQNGEALGAGEYLLEYRTRGWYPRLASERFFVQEDQAGQFADAKYAMLRVSDSGKSLLVGLCDENFDLLGPPLNE